MSSRRVFHGLLTALVAAALSLPTLGTFCATGSCCVCPMERAGLAAPTTPETVLVPDLSCCQRLPAPVLSPVPSAIAAPQLGAPLPAYGEDAAPSLVALDDGPGAHSSVERARAERRHDLGLFTLNSVLLI